MYFSKGMHVHVCIICGVEKQHEMVTSLHHSIPIYHAEIGPEAQPQRSYRSVKSSADKNSSKARTGKRLVKGTRGVVRYSISPSITRVILYACCRVAVLCHYDPAVSPAFITRQ